VGGLTAIGVDPGERFILATSEGKGLTKDEYYDKWKHRKTGPNTKRKDHHLYTTRKARQAEVDCIESELYSAASFKCGADMDALLVACRTFQAHDLTIQRVRATRLAASSRLRGNARRQKNLEYALTKCFPDPEAVVVLGDGYRGRPTQKGDKSGSNIGVGLRRVLAQRRRVVLVHEFRTSITCSRCDTRLTWPKTTTKTKPKQGPSGAGTGTRKPPPAKRNQICPGCKTEVERDLNAAVNMSRLWKQWITDRTRPGLLAFPSRHSLPAP